MADYRVNLDIFAGPMDLLLYLVRKEEVDIYQIPLTKITDQYLKYIEMLKTLDIDIASDFLVMAATLMQIKSAMLLPTADTEGGEDGDLTDPRTELIRQLLEYKKFKDAANLLNAAALDQNLRHPRPATIVETLKDHSEPEVDLDQINIWDLLAAFDTLMAATGAKYDTNHIKDDTPIDLYQIEILHRLQTEGPMSFRTIFEVKKNRVILIGLFLALLELIRDKLICAEQTEEADAIYLKALTSEPAEQAVRKTILVSEPQNSQNDNLTAPTTPQPATQIPIAELPSESTAAHTTQAPPIPIQQLSPDKFSHKSTAQNDEKETVENSDTFTAPGAN